MFDVVVKIVKIGRDREDAFCVPVTVASRTRIQYGVRCDRKGLRIKPGQVARLEVRKLSICVAAGCGDEPNDPPDLRVSFDYCIATVLTEEAAKALGF